MAGAADGIGKSLLLDRLNQEASVPAHTANDFSIRAWLTSAKKCLDQAEEDTKDDDPEAAYVNYVKALTIVAEVIPRHKGMKEMDERKTTQAQEYWAFRKRISKAFTEVEKLQRSLQALETRTMSQALQEVPSPQINGVHPVIAQDHPRSNASNQQSFNQNPANIASLKIPRKRPVGSITPELVYLNGAQSRPSSASPVAHGLDRPSSNPTPPPDRLPRSNEGAVAVPARPNRSDNIFPKANVIQPDLLLSYLSQPRATRPRILLLDVRSKEQYERGCLDAEYVVWVDPILLDIEKSGQALEESLVLSPREQQEWFSIRHEFDLVVIYDEDSRVNSYAGGPIFDIHQARLRNLTVAIFDYAGYRKPLKHVPMLLVGGLQAWCQLVRENPLRAVPKIQDNVVRVPNAPSLAQRQKPRPLADLLDVGRDISKIDLEAESQWLESLHPERDGYPIRSPGLDYVDQRKLNRSLVISPSPPNDPYNKSILDFFQKFPSVEPESMSGLPPNPSRPGSLEVSRRPLNHTLSNSSIRTSPPQRRQSTFIDHPFHGFTEVNDPEFQPPTPTKKSGSAINTRNDIPSPNSMARDEEVSNLARSRIPSIGSQISQVGSVSAGMTGLKNLGNTCYMNSVLQCMSATVPLARYFLSGSYRRSINVANPLGSKGVLANAFAELIKHLWGDQYTHISPVSLRGVVGKLQPRFKNSDQQDAQDFLAFFLDGLHEDLNENALKSKLRELTPEEERRRERMPVADVSSIEWDRYKHNHKSFLVELFQGQFVSSLKCSVCGQTSTTCNAFMNLSIEISLPHGPQGLKLTQCIDAFVKEEILEGENAWNCPNCKRPQRATKQLRIARLPTILIIVLKRFHYEGPWRDKLNTFVDFPMHNLDLTKYALPSSSQSRSPQPEKSDYLYDLYAVTNHFGTLSGGHYTACIHNKLRGKWFVFDDSRVSPCEDSSVVGRSAYILWYKRSNQF